MALLEWWVPTKCDWRMMENGSKALQEPWNHVELFENQTQSRYRKKLNNNKKPMEWMSGQMNERLGSVASVRVRCPPCADVKRNTHTHTHTHRIAGKLGNKKNRQSLRRNATGGVSQVSRRSPRSARLTNRAGPLVAMRKKTSKINVREKRKKMVMIQFISGTDRPVQRPVVRCFSETTRPTRCSSRFYDINPSETR